MSDVGGYGTAVRRLLAGEPAALILAASADPGRLPEVADRDNASTAHQVVGPILEVITVAGSSDEASRLSHLDARSLAESGARVAICEISAWGIDQGSALRRASRVDLLLQNELHSISIGVLDPETEVVSAPGMDFDRFGGEMDARRLVDVGDLASAGFKAFEIYELPEDRRRWLEGLVDFAVEVAPSSKAIRMASSAALEEAGSMASVEAAYSAFQALRSETLRGPFASRSHERALTVSELSMKVICDLGCR